MRKQVCEFVFYVCDFQVAKLDFWSFKLGLWCFVILGLLGRWCRGDFLRFLYGFFLLNLGF